jgi:VanZ family protein
MKIQIEKDKKLHFIVAFTITFILDIIGNLIFKTGIEDAIVSILMLIAIVLWEYLPNRNYSVNDMRFGILGLIFGMLLAKFMIFLFYTTMLL